jgi:C-terminal peptidase (prc)
MKKKQVPLHIYVLSIIFVAVISGGVVYKSQQQVTVGEQSNDELQKVHNLYQELQENYYKDVDKDKLIEGALKGMTEALGDPYTTYFGEKEAEEFTNSLADSFEGIGATLTMVNNIPEVAEAPIKESPAAKGGLKVHDQILAVDGQKTKGKDLGEVVAEIRGKKGSQVVLTIQRKQSTFDVTLTRGKIPIASLKTEMDDNQVTGKIQIASFSESTARELKDAIEKLRGQGAKNFVIDVRQNPGGFLNQVEIMASMFLKDGQTIVKFSSDDKIIGEVTASKELDGGFKVHEPVAVLVDGGSASASEIFAAALKESANVPIVGVQTFGKGTVQTVNELGDKSELKMTVQKWLTPNEEWINEVGLEPSVKVDFPDYAYLPPLSKTTTLHLDDVSEDVKNLNTFLSVLGYETSGEHFDEQTQQAVKEIQRAAKLTVDGIVNAETAIEIERQLTEKLIQSDRMYEQAVDILMKEQKK